MSPETRREFAEAIRTLSGRVDDMERRLDVIEKSTTPPQTPANVRLETLRSANG